MVACSMDSAPRRRGGQQRVVGERQSGSGGCETFSRSSWLAPAACRCGARRRFVPACAVVPPGETAGLLLMTPWSHSTGCGGGGRVVCSVARQTNFAPSFAYQVSHGQQPRVATVSARTFSSSTRHAAGGSQPYALRRLYHVCAIAL